jgi:integrase
MVEIAETVRDSRRIKTLQVTGVGVSATQAKEQEAVCTHLFQRGGRYYIRRRIPVDLIDHYQRKEIQQALGTSDRAEAVVLCRKAGVSLDDNFARARAALHSDQPPILTSTATISLSREQVEAEDEAERLAPEFEADYARRRELTGLLRKVLTEGGITFPRTADHAGHGGHANRGEPLRRAAQTTLPHLIQRWAKERKPERRSVGIAEKVVARFTEHVGDRPVQRITRRDVVRFKDKLLESGQSPVNTDKQLVMFGTLLNFAAANSIIDQNPAKGIRVGERKNARAVRLPFDTNALNAIFGSPVYTQDERPNAGAGEAAYWLPLLALFTGARIEELGQLSPVDVYQEAYHSTDSVEHQTWVLRITDENAGQSLKNAGSRRRFPVHPELLARGFVPFVEAQRGKPRIFNELKPDPLGVESANWGKWFGKYLRKVCGVADPRMVFHSFRHTFKDIARAAGIAEDVSDAITGHSSGSVARNYGGLNYPLQPLVDAMRKYRVSGVKLPQPRS